MKVVNKLVSKVNRLKILNSVKKRVISKVSSKDQSNYLANVKNVDGLSNGPSHSNK